MNPPLDPSEQFFGMWARANAAVWPMEVLWTAAAVAAVGVALRPTRFSDRLIAGFLAAYYAWLGVVFFWVYYSPLNDHAPAAGLMFVFGGALFLLAGVARRDLAFRPRWDVAGATGGALMLYALVAYPAIGLVTGHSFPAAPVFGLAPCPSAIFTAGLLLWSRPRLPMYVLVVPLIWLLAQAPADALALGVVADLARPVAGVLMAGLLVWRDYRATRERLIGGALLVLAALCLGRDDALMILGAAFLLVTFARWLRARAGRAAPKITARLAHSASSTP